MLQRNFKYSLVFFLRYYVLGFPGLVVDAALPHLWPFEMKMGIRVMDPLPETREQFADVVQGALALIAQADGRRHRRVTREIRTIVNLPLPTAASYARPLKVCSVDLRCFFDKDPSITTNLLASALVHEATHGSLFTNGVLRTRRNYSRVEHLCCDEAKRFLVRVGCKDFSSIWDVIAEESMDPVPLWSRLQGLREDLRQLAARDLAGEAAVWKSVGSHVEHNLDGIDN